MRTLLFSSIATLKMGMDTLTLKENVKLDSLLGHGGLFKTEGVAQGLMASALDIPVTVMKNAGEGGAWGIALLAAYAAQREEGETLEGFLDKKVFSSSPSVKLLPDEKTSKGFAAFMELYRKGLEMQKAGADALA
jgi:sugar (pentulose or hexulose) kinase